MKPLLNTLYVLTQGAYLVRDGETLAVRVEGEVKVRVPVHTLQNVVCFGQVSCSPPAMALCAESGVGLAFFTEYGRFLARVQGPVSGNVLLRREQYRRADDGDSSAGVARTMVMGKIANSRNVLLRGAREGAGDAAALEGAARHLGSLLRQLDGSPDLETVRGIEGDAARAYFAAFDELIVANKEAFFFRQRSRRPPLDNMNALLSFLYTLLTHDAASALEASGLDPAVGFLHRDRPGRPSLALDLVEELRPVLGDRLALTLVNRKQIQASDFRTMEGGAVWLTDEGRKKVLAAYQKRKQEEIVHPFLEEKAPLGLVAHLQATLLARHIRRDLDGYPPFLWK